MFRKTNISYPSISTRTCTCQGVKNVSFSENFAYRLNKWSLFIRCKILINTVFYILVYKLISELTWSYMLYSAYSCNKSLCWKYDLTKYRILVHYMQCYSFYSGRLWLRIYESKYWRMDQVKFVNDSLEKIWSDRVFLSKPYHFKFLKGCLPQIFFLVHSGILCPI